MRNLNKFSRAKYMLLTKYFYCRKMKSCGRKAVLFDPMRIDNPESIAIGDGVFVGKGAWLLGSTNQDGRLEIDENTVIGHFAHIVSSGQLHIGKNVLIADKVFITDCAHEYRDVSTPISKQPVTSRGPVRIGDDTMIGENACILGACIGKHCVVGANSVVTRDVSDFSIVGGNPARVLKRYDVEKAEWIKVG